VERVEGADSKHVYRVTVRGQFDQLTDATRAWLIAHLAEHDIFTSKFTEEGTFTYDDRLAFFNLRYEIRVNATKGENEAKALALLEADRFLATMRIGFVRLRAAAMDMSAMWPAGG
jgi:Family of unknown function (DUF6204)